MTMMLKDLPRYECLLELAQRYPDLNPSAAEAYLHLRRTSADVAQTMEQGLAGHNITPGRFGVLILLNRDPEHPVSPADLADRVGVARATMTGLIDTLERDGLVKREPSSEDRRMLLVQLTPKGREFLERILPDHFRRISALMRHLAAPEHKALVALLAKIQQGIPDVKG